MAVKDVLARRLKEIRKKRGFTQEQLAELVDVAPRHISFIETARSFPSGDLLERICKNLNIKYSELFLDDKTLTREELLSNLSYLINKMDVKGLNCLYKLAKEL
ncbi:helix-turn-helix transcriptional regulator [bacterium]|nr:helix-turn-helix transcriptional regulator [bacterium]